MRARVSVCVWEVVLAKEHTVSEEIRGNFLGGGDGGENVAIGGQVSSWQAAGQEEGRERKGKVRRLGYDPAEGGGGRRGKGGRGKRGKRGKRKKESFPVPRGKGLLR